MPSFKTWTRGVTTTCLLMALLLTSFLLSGATSPSSAIRTLYNTELKYVRRSAFPDAPSKSPTPTPTPSPRTVISTRTPQTPTPASTVTPGSAETFERINQIQSPPDEKSTILISYFGICTYNTTRPWQCITPRAKNGSAIPGGAPVEILTLAASLQGALSPLPPIFSITILSSLVIFTWLLSCLRPQTNSLESIVGQIYLITALLCLGCSVFTAVLFQASSSIAYAVFHSPNDLVASKSVAGLAVAWAAVFFTCVAFAGMTYMTIFAVDPRSTEATRRKALAFVDRVFGSAGKTDENDNRTQEVEINQQNIHPALKKIPVNQQDIHPALRKLPVDQQDIHPALRKLDAEHVENNTATAKREVHPQKGTFQKEGTAGRRIRKGNSPFPGWNMI